MAGEVAVTPHPAAARTASAEERRAYTEQGWVRVRGLVDAETCARMRGLAADHVPPLDQPASYRLDPGIWFAEPGLRELWSEPPVVDYVQSLMGDPPAGIELTAGGIFAIGPHTDEVTFWHQEAAVTSDPYGRHLCAAWIALTDVDEQRAPLLVVPQSHLDPVPTFGYGMNYSYLNFPDRRMVPDESRPFPTPSRWWPRPVMRCSWTAGCCIRRGPTWPTREGSPSRPATASTTPPVAEVC